ncbi:MAG: hypothetical protein NTX57_22980, partial [Armatimonadetes bacterium]|nr:hypothetical protein [Armatimonadota bacterium]
HSPVRAGESSSQKEHIAAFWKLATVQPSSLPKLKITASSAPKVETRPLSGYEIFENEHAVLEIQESLTKEEVI